MALALQPSCFLEQCRTHRHHTPNVAKQDVRRIWVLSGSWVPSSHPAWLLDLSLSSYRDDQIIVLVSHCDSLCDLQPQALLMVTGSCFFLSYLGSSPEPCAPESQLVCSIVMGDSFYWVTRLTCWNPATPSRLSGSGGRPGRRGIAWWKHLLTRQQRVCPMFTRNRPRRSGQHWTHARLCEMEIRPGRHRRR